MADTIYMIGKKDKVNFGFVYKIFLYLSFVWANFYATACILSERQYSYFGFFGAYTGNFVEDIVIYAIAFGLVYWALFEIMLFLYRNVLSFSIYSFIVPKTDLKNEARLFFTIKNLVYGAIANLCFLFPYLYVLLEFVNIILVLVLLIVFALRLQKKYSSPLIAHFTFKVFCYPVFVYELLLIIISVVGAL